MRDRLTSGVAFALLVALVVGTWWAADYAQRSVPVDPPRRLTHEMDGFIDGLVMLRTDENGMPAARLESPRALHFPDDDSYEIESPRAISQRPDRSVTVATAERGVMTEDGNRVVMDGNVQLRREPNAGQPGLQITSEQLILRPHDDVAWTDLPAVVTRDDGSRIAGTGMHYDNKTRQLKVTADTRVRLMQRDTPAAELP
jgi:lipopolysaccharide export system protein LptC